MADADRQVLDRIYERWAVGDFAESGHLDPEISFTVEPPLPEAATYQGLGELRVYMLEFLEPWVHVTMTPKAVERIGDAYVVHIAQAAEGKESGVTTTLDYFHVWRFRGGRAVELRSIHGREAAVAAAEAA